MVEEWRTCVEDAQYEVSSYGRVRRVLKDGTRKAPKRSFVKPSGYTAVSIGRRQYRVHRLVLSAFVGPPPEGMVGCHNDGDKSNNRLDNLRWDTLEGNAQDKNLHGTHMKGERHHKAKLTEAEVAAIYLSDERLTDLSGRYGVSLSAVWAIRNNVSWTHVTAHLAEHASALVTSGAVIFDPRPSVPVDR